VYLYIIQYTLVFEAIREGGDRVKWSHVLNRLISMQLQINGTIWVNRTFTKKSSSVLLPDVLLWDCLINEIVVLDYNTLVVVLD